MKELATPHPSQILGRGNLLGSAEDDHTRAVLIAHVGTGVCREDNEGLETLDVQTQAGLVADLEESGGGVGGLESDAGKTDVLGMFVVVFVRTTVFDFGTIKGVVDGNVVVVNLDLREVGVVDLAYGAELGDGVEDHARRSARGQVQDVDGAVAVGG